MRHGHAHAHSDHQHRKKRQYQPSITSFFAYEDSSSDSDTERGPGPITRPQHHASGARRQHQQRDSVIPSVPGSVQADLLSVGMRVRKSVPEGYKTHKMAQLPSIQTTLTKSASTIVTTAEYSVKPPRDAIPEDFQHQRELLPFCGLHKIGGYADQPVTNVHLYGGTDASGERATNLFPLPAEAFSQPFSSQSSTDSSVSNTSLRPNPTNPSKRSWHDEDDSHVRLNTNFLFKVPVKVSEDEVPISPHSATPPPNAFPQGALRPFAQPKTRRQATRAMDIDGMVIKEGDMEMDLENADQGERRVLVGSASDFGEAEFLRPWNTGREVDMGGV